MAVTGFVLALIALLICLLPIVNLFAIVLAIASIVLAALALSKVKKGAGGGKGLAVTGLVLGILAVLGGVGSAVVYGLVLNEVGKAVEQGVRDAESAAGDEGIEAGDDEMEAAADPLPLGETGTVGDYEVTVTKVTLDANEMVAEANSLNEPPTHQYVVVDLDATYTGGEEGNPWLDLSVAVQGSDARQYDDSACDALLPNDAIDVPTLTNGGEASFQFCMDAPPAALDGATLFVEETLTFDDTRVYWNVR